MHLRHLWLSDWRSWEHVDLDLPPDGVAVLSGLNGAGKTNLLEAVAWLATLESFRGAPREVLVRRGCSSAVVRGEFERAGRRILVETELRSEGRDRALLNRQTVRRRSDLLDAVRVSVFSPDELALVKGPPTLRRRFLDRAWVSLEPRADAVRQDVERVLRQRATLLRQAAGRATAEVLSTLDVWDAQLARVGTMLAEGREWVVDRLATDVSDAYSRLSGGGSRAWLEYRRSWDGELAEALAKTRDADVRRAANGLGPQRDELEIGLAGLGARLEASQGEQRTLALALCLALHGAVAASAGSPPVLLLDDVFSELDRNRAEALVEALPPGQVLVATAGELPAKLAAGVVWTVAGGMLDAVALPSVPAGAMGVHGIAGSEGDIDGRARPCRPENGA